MHPGSRMGMRVRSLLARGTARDQAGSKLGLVQPVRLRVLLEPGDYGAAEGADLSVANSAKGATYLKRATHRATNQRSLSYLLNASYLQCFASLVAWVLPRKLSHGGNSHPGEGVYVVVKPG